MKTPDLYFPFYGGAYFQAVKGYSKAVECAYIRALWHYWSHSHCDGIKNDKRYLQAICEASDTDWPEVESALFSHEGFFKLIAGKWHQSRALEEWKKSKAIIAARSAAGKQGMLKRWANKTQEP